MHTAVINGGGELWVWTQELGNSRRSGRLQQELGSSSLRSMVNGVTEISAMSQQKSSGGKRKCQISRQGITKPHQELERIVPVGEEPSSISKTKKVLFGHNSHSRGFPQSKHWLLWKWGSQFLEIKKVVRLSCVHFYAHTSSTVATKPSLCIQNPASSMGITKENWGPDISPEWTKRESRAQYLSYEVWIIALVFKIASEVQEGETLEGTEETV